MPRPLITGNRAAAEYLSNEFRRQHEYSLFAWNQRLTKAEAHALAWQQMRAKLERDKMMQERMRYEQWQRSQGQ